jgi:hypothetical protein
MLHKCKFIVPTFGGSASSGNIRMNLSGKLGEKA